MLLPALAVAFSGVDNSGEDFSSVAASSTSALSSANSQTLSLLSGRSSAQSSIGGGGIKIVNDRALLNAGRAEEVDDENLSDPGEISLYVVREGDTISQIASLFEVTPNTVRWANDISADESIHAGQALVILPVTGIQYTVEESDTIEEIAEEHDGKVREIRQYNDISEDGKLAVGSEIVIPNGEIAPEVSREVPSAASGQTRSTAPSTGGYFDAPLAAGYGKTQGMHGYNAVDLDAARGSSVFASAGGQVIVSKNSGWNGGYGKYVVIKHPNGTQTLYSHMSNVVVGGGSVVQGQVIGYLGSTGRSTGPHLHFEVRGARNPF